MDFLFTSPAEIDKRAKQDPTFQLAYDRFIENNFPESKSIKAREEKELHNLFAGTTDKILLVTKQNLKRVRKMPFYRDQNDPKIVPGCIVLDRPGATAEIRIWVLWPGEDRDAYGYGYVYEFGEWAQEADGQVLIHIDGIDGKETLDLGLTMTPQTQPR